ncbi:unnamed protein product, partial [Prorocentrum cordatum]
MHYAGHGIMGRGALDGERLCFSEPVRKLRSEEDSEDTELVRKTHSAGDVASESFSPGENDTETCDSPERCCPRPPTETAPATRHLRRIRWASPCREAPASAPPGDQARHRSLLPPVFGRAGHLAPAAPESAPGSARPHRRVALAAPAGFDDLPGPAPPAGPCPPAAPGSARRFRPAARAGRAVAVEASPGAAAEPCWPEEDIGVGFGEPQPWDIEVAALLERPSWGAGGPVPRASGQAASPAGLSPDALCPSPGGAS